MLAVVRSHLSPVGAYGENEKSLSVDDRTLTARAADGDVDAFAHLYRRYVDRVHAYVYRRSASRDLAEEITAATFERALRAIPTFRWRDGGFAGWVFRIASNELTSHYRRQTRAVAGRARLAVLDGGLAPAADEGHRIDTEVDVVHMRRALATLNPRYQNAIALRYFADLTHEEAAAAMGVSKPVMAVTLHRAVAALRKAIDKGAGTR